MPIKTVKKITAWSYSRWREYEQCPAKAKYKHVEKLKEPGNAAMDRGSAIHKLAEQYAGGQLKALPTELARFKQEFTALKKAKPGVEQEWAFNKDWGRAGWFDNDAWLRVKVDATYEMKDTGVIIDHKTGRFKEGGDEYLPQMELYGIGGLLVYRKAKRIVTKLWFLDSGDEVVEEFTRDQLEHLQERWMQNTKRMLTDTGFKPTPGNQCRWCHFRKGNGGPCQF